MDPNATLRLLAECMEDGETTEIELDYICYELLRWLSKGGFAPAWHKFPQAHARVNAYLEACHAEGRFGWVLIA